MTLMSMAVQLSACLGPAAYVGIMSSATAAASAAGVPAAQASAEGFAVAMIAALVVAAAGLCRRLLLRPLHEAPSAVESRGDSAAFVEALQRFSALEYNGGNGGETRRRGPPLLRKGWLHGRHHRGRLHLEERGVGAVGGGAPAHVLSHSLHYGSGVFEGIRCYQDAR